LLYSCFCLQILCIFSFCSFPLSFFYLHSIYRLDINFRSLPLSLLYYINIYFV
jgi:hypothetical protein